MLETLSKGIRFNNPGNIEKNGDNWEGLLPDDQQTDPRFYKFSSSYYGIRAIYHIILSYRIKHNLSTISEIISRWAPSVENNTQAYIDDVSSRMKVASNIPLDFNNKELIASLIASIIFYENGEEPYSQQEILQAMQ